MNSDRYALQDGEDDITSIVYRSEVISLRIQPSTKSAALSAAAHRAIGNTSRVVTRGNATTKTIRVVPVLNGDDVPWSETIDINHTMSTRIHRWMTSVGLPIAGPYPGKLVDGALIFDVSGEAR